MLFNSCKNLVMLSNRAETGTNDVSGGGTGIIGTAGSGAIGLVGGGDFGLAFVDLP